MFVGRREKQSSPITFSDNGNQLILQLPSSGLLTDVIEPDSVGTCNTRDLCTVDSRFFRYAVIIVLNIEFDSIVFSIDYWSHPLKIVFSFG